MDGRFKFEVEVGVAPFERTHYVLFKGEEI